MKKVIYKLTEADATIRTAAINAIQYARGFADSDNGVVQVTFVFNDTTVIAYNASCYFDIVEKYELIADRMVTTC